jgi:5,5'-dehydrodivanillate O-demethylase
MLTAERNESLTRVGRGTPVGELFRRYWLPVLSLLEAVAQEEKGQAVSTA